MEAVIKGDASHMLTTTENWYHMYKENFFEVVFCSTRVKFVSYSITSFSYRKRRPLSRLKVSPSFPVEFYFAFPMNFS
jgi:hypothetical protein